MRTYVTMILCFMVLFSVATGIGQEGPNLWNEPTNAGNHQATWQGPGAIDFATTSSKYALVLEGANWNGLTAHDTQTLANEIIGTGVKWVMLSIEWGLYSEPYPPTATCQPSQGPHCYCGPKAACHNYNFTALDQLVNALNGAGIQVGMRFFMHPTWAGGQTCSGFSPPCGAILSAYMNTFTNNLYDLAYNLATRYKGKVAFWAIWNEPNLAYAFSPQDLNAGGGYLINEYMVLIQFPAHAGLTAVIPGALTVGPELYTPNGGGNVKTCDYYGHCGWLYGFGWWEDALLRYYDTNFPTFTIHNYSDTNTGSYNAIANTWNLVMVPLGKQRQIWLTDFNFKSRTCYPYGEQDIVNYTRSLYNLMANERAFYFSLTDGFSNDLCGDGLVHSLAYGWAVKSTLYPGFQSIVSGH